MAKINLLPWREERRKQEMQEFLVVLAGVVVAALFLAFLWKQMVAADVENQKSRNSYIEGQIAQLEESIAEIEELQRRRDGLIERMNVIQGLQGNRPVIVHVFDQFVETLPDGVFYTSIKQTGNKFEVIGVAESNNRISNLMRSLEGSVWFRNPQLVKVVAQGEMFQFQLTLDLENQAAEAAAEAGGQGAAPAEDAKSKKKN